MAQFDVYPNSNANSKALYPYLVDIQSGLLDDLNTRLVVPLADAFKLKQASIKGLTPVLTLDNQPLILMTPHLSSMPTTKLLQPCGSIKHLRSDILAAIDLSITGF